jgi:hypothetical protein
MISAIRNGTEVFPYRDRIITIETGELLQLRSNTPDATSHTWSFDGGSGNIYAENPQVSWSVPGAYSISYTPLNVSRAEFRMHWVVVIPSTYTELHTIEGNGNTATIDGNSTSNSYINCLGWAPGSRIVMSGNFTMSDRITFQGLQGTEANPMTIVTNGIVNIESPGYENCVVFQGGQYIIMCGSTDPNEQYGFRLRQGIQAYGYDWGSGYVAWSHRFYGISIVGQGADGDCGIGFQIKAVNQTYDPDPTKWWFTDTHIIGCYGSDTNRGGEFAYGQYFHKYGIGGFYPYMSSNWVIARCVAERCGRDGVQLGCAVNSTIHDITTRYCGTSDIGDHQNSIQINSGFGGSLYNVLAIGSGARDGRMSVFPYDDTDIFNCIMYNPDNTFAAVFLRSIANQAGAPDVNMKPGLRVRFWNCTFFSNADGLYYFKDQDNIPELWLENLAIRHNGQMFNFTNDQPPITIGSNNGNFFQNPASDLFVDIDNEDYSPPMGGIALSGGKDASGNYNDHMGAYDIDGLRIDETQWHRGAIQYDEGYTPPPEPDTEFYTNYNLIMTLS